MGADGGEVLGITRRGFLRFVPVALARSQDDLTGLYESHDWLALRRRLTPSSPVLYRGAVAGSLHRFREAEKLLRPIARGGADSKEALGHLIALYTRAGRYRSALQSVTEALKLSPQREDLLNARALFAQLAPHPDLRVKGLRPAKLRQHGSGMGLVAPVEINGRRALYFWDTGANFSITTESEAKRLDMPVESSTAKVGTSAGGKIGFRIAWAREIAVGPIQVKNVPFFVFRDDQQPFDELPQEERGGIGLPVQLALGGMRWSRDGEFEVGFPSERGEPNLCFDGSDPVTALGFEGAELPAVLDTGASGTDLWPPFAKRFPKVVERGERRKERVGGVGQNVQLDAVRLEELSLRAGGRAVTLRPADIILENTTSSSKHYHANVGMDVLKQASRVTIDFRTMRFTLD